jgi:mannose-6-phosphate isomerase-like protein (cupin superfamily)
MTFETPPASAFVDVPGMPGVRIATVGEGDGSTLEFVQAVKGAVVPAMHQTGKQRLRVLSGALRFMQDGALRELRAGDLVEIDAGESHGPHVVLEDGTRLLLLREGASAFDA